MFLTRSCMNVRLLLRIFSPSSFAFANIRTTGKLTRVSKNVIQWVNEDCSVYFSTVITLLDHGSQRLLNKRIRNMFIDKVYFKCLSRIARPKSCQKPQMQNAIRQIQTIIGMRLSNNPDAYFAQEIQASGHLKGRNPERAIFFHTNVGKIIRISSV